MTGGESEVPNAHIANGRGCAHLTITCRSSASRAPAPAARCSEAVIEADLDVKAGRGVEVGRLVHVCGKESRHELIRSARPRGFNRCPPCPRPSRRVVPSLIRKSSQLQPANLAISAFQIEIVREIWVPVRLCIPAHRSQMPK